MSRKSRKRNRTTVANNQVRKQESFMEKNKEGSAAAWTEMRQMAVGSLEIDDKYQRGLNINIVKKIVANFNPDLVNVLKVSYRDGHYYVFDGQHTLTAIKMKFKDDGYPVMCKIYYGLSMEEEAHLFAEQTGFAKKVPVAYKLRAQAIAGDEEVTDFLHITREKGFMIEPGKRLNKPGAIEAVKMAFQCYHSIGAEQYGRMLELMNKAWHGEQWSITQNMLSGMCVFMKTFGGCFDSDRFVKKLSQATEREIVREASKSIDIPVPYRYARALAVYYNKGGAKGTLKLNKLSMMMYGEN